MAEVNVAENAKFEEDFQQALEESLSLFPVDELKAEQKLIIEKIVGKRDADNYQRDMERV